MNISLIYGHKRLFKMVQNNLKDGKELLSCSASTMATLILISKFFQGKNTFDSSSFSSCRGYGVEVVEVRFFFFTYINDIKNTIKSK